MEKRMSLLAVPPLQSLHLLKLPDSADDAAARPAISSREGSMRRRAMELRLKTDLIACSWGKSLYKEFPKEPKGPKKEGGVAGVLWGSMIFPGWSPKSETTFVKQNRKLVNKCDFRFW